jgi:phage anti-repressor protein
VNNLFFFLGPAGKFQSNLRENPEPTEDSWFNRMTEYGFVENITFLKQNTCSIIWIEVILMDLKKIRDRGKMKWVGFMMPEHTTELRKLSIEYELEKKPEIDEFLLTEFDEKILLAMEFHYLIQFKLWEGGKFDSITARITRYDEQSGTLYVKKESGDLKKIHFKQIVGLDIES